MSGTYPATPEFSAVKLESLQPNIVTETRTGRRQVRSVGGQRWAFTAKYNDFTRAEFMPVYAFVLAQAGQLETFTIVPPVISSTSGTATGSVTSSAASIGATSVTIAGLTGILKAGDFVKFASHTKVYMVTADRSGAGAMSIIPALVTATGAVGAVTYNSVPFTVRLNNDLQSYSLSGYDRYTYEIDMVEAL